MQTSPERYTHKKVSPHFSLRIKHQLRHDSPESPIKQGNGSASGASHVEIQSMLSQIPRTIELTGNVLVEGCFSYVDEGLEKWKVGNTIGKGNSYVRRALNMKNGEVAAVKQIVLESKDERERLAEIKILRNIQHPNIVSYLEHYKVKDETWIFMEYINRNLRFFLLEYGAPPVSTFFKFARQVVEALAELERNKIIHGDIKCENVLMSNDGVLKLCDFGCSKDFRSTLSLRLYEKGSVKGYRGSYLWTAPECLINKPCMASDIWSFGCLLIEMASGKLPWHEKNFDNHLQAALHIVYSGEIPYIDPAWDEKIQKLLRCCLQREPSQRITALQLLQKSDFWS